MKNIRNFVQIAQRNWIFCKEPKSIHSKTASSYEKAVGFMFYTIKGLGAIGNNEENLDSSDGMGIF